MAKGKVKVKVCLNLKCERGVEIDLQTLIACNFEVIYVCQMDGTELMKDCKLNKLALA